MKKKILLKRTNKQRKPTKYERDELYHWGVRVFELSPMIMTHRARIPALGLKGRFYGFRRKLRGKPFVFLDKSGKLFFLSLSEAQTAIYLKKKTTNNPQA